MKLLFASELSVTIYHKQKNYSFLQTLVFIRLSNTEIVFLLLLLFFVKVELSCTSRFFDITYIVTLYPVSMATAVIVKNKAPKPVTLTNAILSHFRFKKRSGTAIQGLRSCSYCLHPPLSSPFQILTPAEATKSEPPVWLSFGAEPEAKPGTWTQQGLSLTLLENKTSRVYAAPPNERSKAFYNTPPSKYETIDQVRMIYIVNL